MFVTCSSSKEIRISMVDTRISSLEDVANTQSFRRLGLAGWNKNFFLPFPKTTFSIGEMLVLDRLVMNRSVSSANYLKICFSSL